MSTILKALRRLEEEKRSHAESLEERLVDTSAVRVTARSSRFTLGIGIVLGSMLAMGLVAVLVISGALAGSDDAPVLASVARVADSPAYTPTGRAGSTPEAVLGARARVPVAPKRPAAEQQRHESAPTSVAAPESRPLTLASVTSPRVEPEIPDEETSRASSLVAPSRRDPSSRSARLAEVADRSASAPVSAPPTAAPVAPVTTVAAVDPESAPQRTRSESSLASPLARAVALEAVRSPELFVSKTIWHPDPKRRLAFVEISGRPVRQLALGDEIEGYTIVDIGLSRIELTRAGVSSIRRVGSR